MLVVWRGRGGGGGQGVAGTPPRVVSEQWGGINSRCAEASGNSMRSNLQLACQAHFQQFGRNTTCDPSNREEAKPQCGTSRVGATLHVVCPFRWGSRGNGEGIK